MSSSDLGPPADRDPRIGKLYDYWRSLRPVVGSFPGRQHLDPGAIADLLPWVWMVDVRHDPLRFKYRLIGTEQVAAMEADFTGRWMDEAHPKFLRSAAYREFVAAAEEGAVGYRSGPPLFQSRAAGAVERLLLALSVYHTST
jgi:PAS domain